MKKPNNGKRVSRSPEWLDLADKTYSQESACAMTFLFVGKVVATSHRPHTLIINGARAMSSPRDMKSAKDYSVSFSSPPDEDDLADFKAKWVSALGEVRRRTKAGRIWIDVPDGKGGTCSVISFWGPRRSIKRRDIDAVASVFRLKGRLLIEFIDSQAPGRYEIRCQQG